MKIETFDQYQNIVSELNNYPNDSDGIKAIFFAMIGSAARVGECLRDSILNNHKIIQEDKDKIAWNCAEVIMYVSIIMKIWNVPMSRFMLNNDIKSFGMKLRVEPAIIYRYGTRLIFTATQFANVSISGFLIPDIKKAHVGTITTLACTIMIALGIDLNDAFSDFINKQKKEIKDGSTKDEQAEEATKPKTKAKDSKAGTVGDSGRTARTADSGSKTKTDKKTSGKNNGNPGRSKRNRNKGSEKTTKAKTKTGKVSKTG